MKNWLFYFVPTLFVLFSCQKPEVDNPQAHFKVENTSLILNNTLNAGTSFPIQSGVSWTISTAAGWLDISPANGIGNANIQVTAREANYGPVRTAIIIIAPVNNASIEPITVSITQKTGVPAMVWSKLYGGTNRDFGRSVAAAADGGYVMAGSEEGKGAFAVKYDAGGNHVWSKVFGAPYFYEANSIVATNDGGFIVAGSIYSNESNVTAHPGTTEVWMVKLDANGSQQWSKTFGGSKMDYANSVVATADGGYIVAGTTTSNDGDFTGNHPLPVDPNVSFTDCWVMKLDAFGNKQWCKLYGGTGGEWTRSILATTNDGFLLTGITDSNDGDVSGGHGDMDAWAVKLDASGNLQWSKTLGGTQMEQGYSAIATPDGGFVVAGYTYSNDGDVKGNHGIQDAWLVKLDADGNKLWTKTYGGAGFDMFLAVIPSAGGGYILAGGASSNDGDVSGGHGDMDAWAVKLDASGNLQWNKVFGGTGWDYFTSVKETSDGGLLLVGYSDSNNGDVSGNHGGTDAWTIKIKAP